MELIVFAVGHGFCAYLLGDPDSNGRANIALFDCGHDPSKFQPSRDLPRIGCSTVEHLIISHYDQDHLRDLPQLLRNPSLPIGSLYRNKSMSPEQIRALKLATGPLEPGVEAIISMASTYSHDVTPMDRAVRALAGVDFAFFSNPYPTFVDTNNLSFVTLVHHRSVSLIFPGDLEAAGWRALLLNQEFRDHLSRVTVFIASHHGRSNGYAAEIFDYCHPELVVVSDTYKQYSTQEQRYDQHARGIRWDWGPNKRKSLCTRSDGNIHLFTKPEGGFHVSTRHDPFARRRPFS